MFHFLIWDMGVVVVRSPRGEVCKVRAQHPEGTAGAEARTLNLEVGVSASPISTHTQANPWAPLWASCRQAWSNRNPGPEGDATMNKDLPHPPATAGGISTY